MSNTYKVILVPGNKSEHDLGEHTFQNPVHKDETISIINTRGSGEYKVEEVSHSSGVIGRSVLMVNKIKE